MTVDPEKTASASVDEIEPSQSLEPPENQVLQTVTETVTLPVTEDGWCIGKRVTVDATDLPPSLANFDGRQGVIWMIKDYCEQCLIDFGGDEFMHVPFRGLRRV